MLRPKYLGSLFVKPFEIVPKTVWVKPLLLGAKCGERESLINETSTRVVYTIPTSVFHSAVIYYPLQRYQHYGVVCNFLAEPGIICQMPFIDMSL